ncbi:hypothetical protein K466DRAFT_666286 [Polyporus arcularius HHB13444]|uniref:ER transporter 6TM N-terminal domain-containing protein n=1 Tax=Polyporus arcularius HHB13444 TaxID=1314778 RepID=A0A5C3NZH0_9APHY|nr:hypothetical protein K466DRAFT_666286 [Polyporus arcularius HHB13444]
MSSEKTQNERSIPSSLVDKKPSSLWDTLPPWVSSNLRSWKSWKVLLRCWAVTWVCLVIMLPDKSLATLGNTAFFALLLSIMLPPNMPVQIFMITVTTLVLGIALGWAISCAGMAAALAARDQTLLKQTLQKEAQSTAGMANPDALYQVAIFNGDFLDTRSTVVYGVFLGFGCFLFALIRAYAPKLTLMSVFGTIAIDIFCSYGPLFPFAQYTLLNSMLTAVACYIAIAVIFITFAFPETLNHSYLGSSAQLLDKLKDVLALQGDVLGSDPHDVGPGSPLATKATMARVGMLTQLQQLMSQKQMLNLEFTWGRWNGDDVQEMLEPIQILASRLGSLNGFVKMMAHPMTLADPPKEDDTNSDGDSVASGTTIGDTYLLRQFRERNIAAETEHHVRLVDILPTIREATADVRDAGIAVLGALKELIVAVNTKRYKRSHSEQDARLLELDRALSALRTAMEDFKDDKRLLLLQPYQHLFEQADAGLLKVVPLRSLYLAFVFTANLTAVSNGIVALAENVSHTAAKRRKARLWAPKGLRAIGKVLRSGRGSGEDAVGEDAQKDEDVQSEDVRRYKLDPDSRPPQNILQRVANVIHRVYKWTKTPEALFTFRYVLVTIALWIPQVVRPTAHFVYAQRGVWALIMAQTTMNIYASDQVFNYVMRIGGTFVGALFGMVCWYIGAGHGTGNPYGLAAITGAFLLPLVFLRIYAPPQYLVGILMTGATFVLVVGYSWIDGNLPGVLVNVGMGWQVTWRRWLLVMIGCAASFILMMFPPKSGRKAVRLRNAAVISGISYLYSHITSLWLSAGEPFEAARQQKGASANRVWSPQLREKVISIAEQLQDLRVRTVMSKWEGSIRGAWAFEDYNQLVELENDMLGSLILMAGALVNMDPDLRKTTLPHTFVLNPHFISDVVSMFFVLSQSLRTGEPLHAAQCKNLADRLQYHSGYAFVSNSGAVSASHSNSRKALRQSIGSYEYMFYATAVVAVLNMASTLNELRRVVADLCGEVPLEGFEQWREEYDRSRMLA